MSKNEAGLSAKQAATIEALLTSPTHQAAAKQTGISRATLTRWLAEPRFKAAYQAARSEVLQSVLMSLQTASVQAVDCLRGVMANLENGASVRVSAAKAILDNLLRAREALDVEERLTTLEQSLGDKK